MSVAPFFTPRLEILPAPQRVLWEELYQTPEHFTLYGGTGLALHFGHRQSVDFDFFTHMPFQAEDLLQSIPYLKGAERLDVGKNSLTCRVDRDGKIKIQFFGGLSLGKVEPRQQPTGTGFWVAHPLDIAGTKVKVLPERSEEKDYIDVYALMRYGITLPTMLAAAKAIYGAGYNPVLSVKALTYFADVKVSADIQNHLTKAAIAIDLTKLPVLYSIQTPYMKGNKP